MEDRNRKREVEAEIKQLAQNGIVCTIEGENVLCTTEAVRKVEGLRVPLNLFNAELVRKNFEEAETAPETS